MCKELEDGYAMCPISSCTEPIVKEEELVQSRFDYNVYICPQCKSDGN